MLQQLERRTGCLAFSLQHSSFDTAQPISIRSLDLARMAYHRLRFRIAVAISAFQYSEWQAARSCDGLHLPLRKIGRYTFPPYDMGDEERAWIALDATERRQSVQNGIAGFLTPAIVELIEANAVGRREDSYLLAWELLSSFIEVFEPLYAVLVHEMAAAENIRDEMPDLASAIFREWQEKRDWSLTDPQSPLHRPQ